MFLLGLFFFLKELSALHFVAGQTINGYGDCADNYPNNWHDLYNGNRNTTITGKPCKKWSESDHPSHGTGNYCRCPSGDVEVRGPWCYISEPPWWDFCFVPRCNKDCRPSNIDKDYSGTLNITQSGFTCRMWSDTLALLGGPPLPMYKHELMNYCRSPITDSEQTPWCYVSSTYKRWESCNVPLCGTITTAVCPDLKGKPHMIKPKRLTGYRYGDVVTFNCDTGYTLNMNTSLRCLAQSQTSIFGKWNSSQPECISTLVCQHLIVGEGVVVNGHRTTIYFNEPVTLSCKEGFNGSPIQITCNHDGTWPVQRPTCTPVPCPPLNKTEHMDPSIKKTGYHFGNNITFQCVVGYSLSGPLFITCRSSKNKSMGHWSDQQPSCIALPCPSLKLPMYSLNKDMKESKIYYIDQNVDFKCEKGYNLIGNGTFKCTVKSNSSVVDWNYEDDQTCVEKSKSCNDYMEKRSSCMSYGLFGGTLAVFVAISAGVHIATCFFFQETRGKICYSI